MPYYAVDPKDRDMIIRTVIGEADNQPAIGQAAVAHVIMNRVNRGYGNTPTSVVLSPKQFEPWSTRSKSLMKINPDSARYQRTAQIVDGVLSGQIPDPTGGMTHFLEPSIVMKRYGKLPGWAQGQGLQIGDHRFFSPGQPEVAQNAVATSAPQNAQDAISKAIGVKVASNDPNAPLAFAEATGRDASGNVAKQPSISDTLDAIEADSQGAAPPQDHSKALDAIEADAGVPQEATGQTGNEAVGERFPAQSMPQGQLTADQTSIEPKNESAGEFINRKIAENQGSSVGETAARVGFGALKGVKDVSNTLAQGISWLGVKGAEGLENLTKDAPIDLAKGAGDATKAWRQRLNDRIDRENADFDRLAGLSGQLGRVAGNVAATAIPGGMAGRAVGLGAKAAASEGLTGLVSGVARGAAGGATAALGSSSASKEDLGTQVLGGALGGAVVGGSAKAARAFEKSLHESTATKLLTGLALGGLGVGEYGKDPAQIQSDILKFGALSLLVKAGKHADKILPALSGAIGTQGASPVDITIKSLTGGAGLGQ